ncbi:uncharacterized protein LOC111249865 isoform X2 [Varroa destructor]|nr:uncharacterized protein LOC111249865 isoform X2 [Varroa destructor]XP_022660038.1 uncharacterized protein LOC111249865 isoform X2 [Varroa destructor]XP_022660039.1 uncharacterized protein LOC111249865 isoform X2 [Varroa destructor]
MGVIQTERRMNGYLPDYDDADGEYKGGGPARVWFEDGREIQVVLVAGVNPRVFCAICECLPQRANLMRCGNILCDRCVGRYTFLMERPCPCGRGGTWDCGNPFRYRLEDRQLNELMVECPNLSEGCEVFVPLMDLDRHLEECTKGPVSVPATYDRQLFECVVSMVENVCLALNVGLERDMETTEEQIAAFIDAPLHKPPASIFQEPTMVLTEVCSVAPDNIDDINASGKVTQTAAEPQGTANIFRKGKILKKEKRVVKTPVSTSTVRKISKSSPQGHAPRLKELEVLYTDEGVLKLLESGVTGRTRGSRRIAEDGLGPLPPKTPIFTEQKTPAPSLQKTTIVVDSVPAASKGNIIESQLETKDLAPQVVIERISPSVSLSETTPRLAKRETDKRISRELQALLAAQEEAGDALIKPEHPTRRDKSETPVSSEDKNRSISPEARKSKLNARKSTGIRRINKSQPDADDSDEQDNQLALQKSNAKLSQQKRGRSRSRGRSNLLMKTSDGTNQNSNQSKTTESLDVPRIPDKVKVVQRMQNCSQTSSVQTLRKENEPDVEPKTNKPSKSSLMKNLCSTAIEPVDNEAVIPQQTEEPSKEKTKRKSAMIAAVQPKSNEGGTFVSPHSNENTDNEVVRRRTRSRFRARSKPKIPLEADSQIHLKSTAPTTRSRSRPRVAKMSVEQESSNNEDIVADSKTLQKGSIEVQKKEDSEELHSNADGVSSSLTNVTPRPTTDEVLPGGLDMPPTDKAQQHAELTGAVFKVPVKPSLETSVADANSQVKNQSQEEVKSQSVPALEPTASKVEENQFEPLMIPSLRRPSIENDINNGSSKSDSKDMFKSSGTVRDPRKDSQSVAKSDVKILQSSDNSKSQVACQSDVAGSVAATTSANSAISQKEVQEPRQRKDASSRPTTTRRNNTERPKANIFKIPKRYSTDVPQELGSPIAVIGGSSSDTLSWQVQGSLLRRRTQNKESAGDITDEPKRKRDKTARWNSPTSTDSSGSRASRKEDSSCWSSHGTRTDPVNLKKFVPQDSDGQYPAKISLHAKSDSREPTEPLSSNDKLCERKRSHSPRSKGTPHRSPSSGRYLRTQSRHRSRSRPRDDPRARSSSYYRGERHYGPRRNYDERTPLIRYAHNDGASGSRDYSDTQVAYSSDKQEHALMRDRKRFAYIEAVQRLGPNSVDNKICDLPAQMAHHQPDQSRPHDTLCREIPVEPLMVIKLPQRKPSERPVRSVVELPRPMFVPDGQEVKGVVERESIRDIPESRDKSAVERRISNRDPRFNRRGGHPAEAAVARPSAGSTSSLGPLTMSLDEMTNAIETALLQLGRHRGDNSLYEQFTRDYGNCRNQEEQRVIASRYWAVYAAGVHRYGQDTGGFSAGCHMVPGIQQDPAGIPYVSEQTGKLPQASNFVTQPYGAAGLHKNLLQPHYMGQHQRLPVDSNTPAQQMHSQYVQSQYIDPFPTGPNSYQPLAVQGRPGDTRAPLFIMDDDGSRFSDDEEKDCQSRRSLGRRRSRSRGSNSRWRGVGSAGFRPDVDRRSRY